jgi:hypothetical protein
MFTLNGSANPAIVVPSPGVISHVDSGVPGSSFSHTTGLAQPFGFSSACASELPDADGEGEADGDGDADADGEGDGDADADGEGEGEGEADGDGDGEAEAAGCTEAALCAVTEAARGAVAVMTPTTVTAATTAAAVDEATSRTCFFRARTRARL